MWGQKLSPAGPTTQETPTWTTRLVLPGLELSLSVGATSSLRVSAPGQPVPAVLPRRAPQPVVPSCVAAVTPTVPVAWLLSPQHIAVLGGIQDKRKMSQEPFFTSHVTLPLSLAFVLSG